MAKRKSQSKSEVTITQIESVIHVIRGQRVMLDSDLARFYGVTTSALNPAVKRNMDRFPEDFAFQLSQQELTDLKSHFVMSKEGAGGRRTPPRAFTEHGVAMLSGVLRSPTPVKVNIEIMRAFVRMRRLMATPGELVEQNREVGGDGAASRRPNPHDHSDTASNDGPACTAIQGPHRLSPPEDVVTNRVAGSGAQRMALGSHGGCDSIETAKTPGVWIRPTGSGSVSGDFSLQRGLVIETPGV